MGLVDDLKTFVIALALGVALTLSVNYVVVNYTESPYSALAHEDYDHDDDDDEYYQTPKPAPKSAGGGSYRSYY